MGDIHLQKSGVDPAPAVGVDGVGGGLLQVGDQRPVLRAFRRPKDILGGLDLLVAGQPPLSLAHLPLLCLDAGVAQGVELLQRQRRRKAALCLAVRFQVFKVFPLGDLGGVFDQLVELLALLAQQLAQGEVLELVQSHGRQFFDHVGGAGDFEFAGVDGLLAGQELAELFSVLHAADHQHIFRQDPGLNVAALVVFQRRVLQRLQPLQVAGGDVVALHKFEDNLVYLFFIQHVAVGQLAGEGVLADVELHLGLQHRIVLDAGVVHMGDVAAVGPCGNWNDRQYHAQGQKQAYDTFSQKNHLVSRFGGAVSAAGERNSMFISIKDRHRSFCVRRSWLPNTSVSTASQTKTQATMSVSSIQ